MKKMIAVLFVMFAMCLPAQAGVFQLNIGGHGQFRQRFVQQRFVHQRFVRQQIVVAPFVQHYVQPARIVVAPQVQYVQPVLQLNDHCNVGELRLQIRGY